MRQSFTLSRSSRHRSGPFREHRRRGGRLGRHRLGFPRGLVVYRLILPSMGRPCGNSPARSRPLLDRLRAGAGRSLRPAMITVLVVASACSQWAWHFDLGLGLLGASRPTTGPSPRWCRHKPNRGRSQLRRRRPRRGVQPQVRLVERATGASHLRSRAATPLPL